MSLTRNPITVLLCTLLLAMVLTTAISIDAVETALTNRLRNTDREVAHAIAIGLSRQNASLEDAQSLIDAHFALGSYQKLRLLDGGGKSLYVRERQHPAADTGLQDTRLFWLWTLRPREQLAPAVAPVKPNPLGVAHVSVQSILSFDHHSSERWLIRLLAIFGTLSALSSGALLWMTAFRQRDLRHLEAVLGQLLKSGRITLPAQRSPEFNTAFHAIGQLDEQIRLRTQRAMEQVEALNRLRRTDPASGLLNRDALSARLEQMLAELMPGQAGHLLLVRMLNLQQLNAEHGRHHVDNLLSQLGRALSQLADAESAGVCGRLSGTDIALASGADNATLETLRDGLRKALEGSPVRTRVDDIHFNRDERVTELLRRCEVNQAIPGNQTSAESDLRTQWYERLNWALSQHHFFLQGFRLTNAAGQTQHREYYLRLPERTSGVVHTGGTLIAWAEHLSLAGEIDLEVAKLALTMAANQADRVCINMSATCLTDPVRRNALIDDLRLAPQYSGRIDIELSEQAAFNHLDLMKSFVAELQPLGVRVGIDHLDEHAGSLIRLQSLGIRYVKVASTLTAELLDARLGRERNRLLAELVHAAHDLSIQIHAENVATTVLAEALFDLGFDGISGPAIGD